MSGGDDRVRVRRRRRLQVGAMALGFVGVLLLLGRSCGDEPAPKLALSEADLDPISASDEPPHRAAEEAPRVVDGPPLPVDAKLLARYRADFGSEAPWVLVARGDVLTVPFQRRLARLEAELRRLPGVLKVVGLDGARVVHAHGGIVEYLALSALIERDKAVASEAVAARPRLLGWLMDAAQERAYVRVIPRLPADPSLRGAISGVVARYGEVGFEVSVTPACGPGGTPQELAVVLVGAAAGVDLTPLVRMAGALRAALELSLAVRSPTDRLLALHAAVTGRKDGLPASAEAWRQYRFMAQTAWPGASESLCTPDGAVCRLQIRFASPPSREAWDRLVGLLKDALTPLRGGTREIFGVAEGFASPL